MFNKVFKCFGICDLRSDSQDPCQQRQIVFGHMAEKSSLELVAHCCWFGLAKQLHYWGPESCLTLLNMDVCVRIVVIPMPENRTT